MDRLEFIKPKKDFSFTENLGKLEKEAELTVADRIHNRIEVINDFIKERSSPKFREIFEEYNIFAIQKKIAQLEDALDNSPDVSPVKDNHLYHTLGNLLAGLRTLERAEMKTVSEALQASGQKNIIEVGLHLDKMLQDKKYFRESLETQHGYEKTLH